MTKSDIVQRLWDFISSTPEKDDAGTTIINAEARAILEACNASLQEIAHYAPRAFFKQTRSSVLRAPVTGTITVTEDSKTFTDLRIANSTEFGVSASNTSDTLTSSASAHGLAVGNKVRFTDSPATPFVTGVNYHVVSVPAANTFKVSTTKGGNAITATSSASFNYDQVFSSLPEGCSIEIAGSDEVMRINTIKNESDITSVRFYDHALVLGITKKVFLEDMDDLESWQNNLAVGDAIKFLGETPTGFDAGTTYYVVSFHSVGGFSQLSGASTHARYIELSATPGGTIITGTGAGIETSIVKITATDDANNGTFFEEYLGTTGTKTCTVYYDAIKLNGKVTEVLGTVVLNDESVLTPLMNNDQSSRMHRDRLNQSERFGEYGSGWELPGELQEKKGTPSYYYVDSEHNEVTNGQDYYLRVRPFPEKKARLRFTASILPDKFIIQDTYSNTGQIKDTGCPSDYDETILMPFIYKNFVKFIGWDVMPAEGSLQSGNILLQIDEDYRQAIEILKELEPQVERQAVYGVAW